MRSIKIKIQLAKNVTHKKYSPETCREEFLKDSGIDVEVYRKICPETFTPFMLGNILDEEKFSKYIIENDLDYQEI